MLLSYEVLLVCGLYVTSCTLSRNTNILFKNLHVHRCESLSISSILSYVLVPLLCFLNGQHEAGQKLILAHNNAIHAAIMAAAKGHFPF